MVPRGGGGRALGYRPPGAAANLPADPNPRP